MTSAFAVCSERCSKQMDQPFSLDAQTGQCQSRPSYFFNQNPRTGNANSIVQIRIKGNKPVGPGGTGNLVLLITVQNKTEERETDEANIPLLKPVRQWLTYLCIGNTGRTAAFCGFWRTVDSKENKKHQTKGNKTQRELNLLLFLKTSLTNRAWGISFILRQRPNACHSWSKLPFWSGERDGTLGGGQPLLTSSPNGCYFMHQVDFGRHVRGPSFRNTSGCHL